MTARYKKMTRIVCACVWACAYNFTWKISHDKSSPALAMHYTHSCMSLEHVKMMMKLLVVNAEDVPRLDWQDLYMWTGD